MRSLVINELGSLDNLHFVERELDLRKGSVRVEVRACGVNYVDAIIIEGKYQIKPPTPYFPGGEIVGVVTEAAEDIFNVAIGDRVFAPVGVGGFSDEVVIAADRLIPLRSTMSDGQAATFMQSYMTGWFALTRRARVEAGKTLLVLGAGSGVGLAAVDIGNALGLKVIAAASTEDKRKMAVSRGAIATIDVTTEDVKERAKELSGGGIDYLYDPVGGELGETCLRAIGDDGQYIVIGFVGGIPRLPANQILLRNRRVTGVDWGAWVSTHQKENIEMLNEVLVAIENGQLNPVEPMTFPLADAVGALRALQSRTVAGKIALIP
jgi:NADPH2:quinone reductase